MNKVYKFSNENLTSYQELYDFTDKKVLSVIGSGDQFFSSILYGAKEVVCFDMNPTSELYLMFKYIAIKCLSYNEFIEFFINSNMKNENIYMKIRSYLNKDIRRFFDINFKLGLNKLTYLVIGFERKENTHTGRVIPYLDEGNYNLLKKMLNYTNIPVTIINTFPELIKDLEYDYDLMLLSNVYSFLGINIKEYNKIMIECFKHMNDKGVIQANYVWNKNSDFFEGFFENNYEINEVYGVQGNLSNNYVATLRKK